MMSQDELSEQSEAEQMSQGQILNITLLASEWKSSAGGLSTLNRELAIHLAQIQNVRVSLLVPEGACNDEDKREAGSFGISILDAKKCVSVEPLLWLSNPPQDHKIDVIVGHGVKLGCQVQLIKRQAQFQNCKWVHVVHTAPEDLSKYKGYSSPISRGEEKHWDEVGLCKCADLVVPVGPRLAKAYHSYLQECKKDEDFFELIPGLFEREFGDLPSKQKPKDESDDFIVLLCGRGDEEDFQLKGYNIAVKAFADQKLKGEHYSLLFVGSPEGKQDEVRERLLKYGITNEQLTVREFVKSRERMKELFCEVDMVIMPSKSEGFGLIALEALSAGLPILVGSNSGFARAIKNIPFGKYRIIRDSEDPAKWAEAIEDVRDTHGVVLRENKMLKEHYSEEYCWKKQCKDLVGRLWKMGCAGTSSAPTVAAADKVEQRPSAVLESVCQTDPKTMQQHIEEAAGTSARKKGLNTNDSHSVCQSKTKDDEIALATYKNKQHLRELGGNLVKLLITTPALEGEKQRIVYEMLASQVQTYAECLDHSKDKQKGVGAMTESIIKTYGLFLENVGMGSLIITFNCQSLKSLEHLWNDYLSGHLDKMAEQYLVTNEMKEKLNMETIGLKTTIEKENYLQCRRLLMERSGTSAAQAIVAEDSMKQQSPVILQAVCQPDRTLQQQFKEGVSTLGNKSPKKLGKRGVSESSAEHDMDTHEITKVQRLQEQLHRVIPEAFYEPGSLLKLEVNEEEKVLATSEDEQHLRDFGGMNINEEIQRSEQHLPSVSSETFSESCSTHKSKINDEEKSLASNRNKEYLGEIGEESKRKKEERQLSNESKAGPPETLCEEYDAFICYARPDKPFADEVLRKLEQWPYRFKVCIDYRDFLSGSGFDQLELAAKAIEQNCKKVLVIMSENLTNYAVTDFQAKVALSLSPAAQKRILIPIKYKPCTVPPWLRHLFYLDYTTEEARLHFWKKLLMTLGYKDSGS